MIQIVPLNKTHLSKAQALVDLIFPQEAEEVRPSQMLAISLEDPLNEEASELLQGIGVTSLRYFVALNDGKVAGTSGLYTESDEEDTVWLGWYCVDESYRRQKIGQQLLDDVLQRAKESGFHRMKIYSDENAEAASGIYRSNGFVETGRENGMIYWEQSLVE